MTRTRCLLAAALLAAASAADAKDQPYDPKGLARYDVSYVQCEASFPEMKGHRDDAYLSLWRVKPSAKTAARLAEIRSGSSYQAERKVATTRQAASASEPEAAKALQRQCRGLWGEMERMPRPAR